MHTHACCSCIPDAFVCFLPAGHRLQAKAPQTLFTAIDDAKVHMCISSSLSFILRALSSLSLFACPRFSVCVYVPSILLIYLCVYIGNRASRALWRQTTGCTTYGVVLCHDDIMSLCCLHPVTEAEIATLQADVDTLAARVHAYLSISTACL